MFAKQCFNTYLTYLFIVSRLVWCADKVLEAYNNTVLDNRGVKTQSKNRKTAWAIDLQSPPPSSGVNCG